MGDDKRLLEKISDDIVEIKVTLAKQNESLAHHVKRTDLLEDKVDILREEVSKARSIKEFLLFAAKISPLIGVIILGIKKLL
jgi:hypothetical protein